MLKTYRIVRNTRRFGKPWLLQVGEFRREMSNWTGNIRIVFYAIGEWEHVTKAAAQADADAAGYVPAQRPK